MTKEMRVFDCEVTDTFGGEANYCWVKRHKVYAKNYLGAIQKLSRITGLHFRIESDFGDMKRYKAQGALVCVCAFIMEV